MYINDNKDDTENDNYNDNDNNHIYIYTNRNNGEIISMSLAPKRSPGLCALRSLRSHRNAAEELGGHRVVAAGRGDAQRSARNSAVSW